MGVLKGFLLAIKALFCGQATLIAENLALRQQAPKDVFMPLTQPPGDYVVDRWEVNQTDDKGVRWQLIAKSSRDRVSFTVTDGEETKLNIGQPVVCDVLISKSGNGYRINQELKGRLGERISVRRNGRRPFAPKVHITNADGSYDRNFRLEYG